MFKKLLASGAVAAVALFAASSAKAEGRVLRMDDLIVYGHPQKPLVMVEVNKVPPTVTLADLRQPLADRVEASTTRDPF